MIKSNLFMETQVHKVVDSLGCFSVIEYAKDFSVNPEFAAQAFFSSKMNVRRKQVVAKLEGNGIITQVGAMQMMLGGVNAKTGLKGVGDFAKKLISGKVTGESAVKPEYTGDGIVLLEPTYKYVVLCNLADWNGNMVIEDGSFLACDNTVKLGVAMRNTISSAVAGKEGLFNTLLTGDGIVVLESRVPKEELIEVELQDDIIRIDGSMAVAWSNSLEFTVEKTTKTLVGSAATGEGFVNVYRGTGRILIAPVS